MTDLTAADLVRMIRKKYPCEKNGYNPSVVLEQVPDATGGWQHHWIDVAVFHMWGTNTRAAFEVKVSRSDFLNELNHLEKHQWCRDSFHEFWFVAPKDVIQVEELPPGVGWMYPRGEQLCIGRRAQNNPTPKLDNLLLAAFLRAAHKEISATEKRTANDVLDNDTGYKHAKWYQGATLKYLESHGNKYFIPESEADIFKALEQATMDQQVKEDRDNLLAISGQFQQSVAGLLNWFLVLASKSIIARDEMGKRIVSRFGSNDTYGVEAMRDLVKSGKRDDLKRYAEMITLLASWEDIKA